MSRQVFIPHVTGHRVWNVEPPHQPHAEYVRVVCPTLKAWDTGEPLVQFVHPNLMVPVPAGARTTDPDTAHQAAAAARQPGDLSDNHRLVLSLLNQHGPLTDFGLSEMALRRGINVKPTSIGKRRQELATIGCVADSGQRAPTDTGRSAVVWRLTDTGRKSFVEVEARRG